MKTKLPESILTVKDAEQLLNILYLNGEDYHPEDSAKDCLSHIATPEECELLDQLMDQIYFLEGGTFDPCKYLLDLVHATALGNFLAACGKFDSSPAGRRMLHNKLGDEILYRAGRKAFYNIPFLKDLSSYEIDMLTQKIEGPVMAR